jgi:alpha-mannosidase
VHDDPDIVERRLDRVRRQLIAPHRYGAEVPFEVSMWQVPDEPDGLVGEPVPVDVAVVADYQPAGPGTRWGPPWSTTWFRLAAEVPADWSGRQVEAIVDLGFGGIGAGFVAEGMIWSPGQDGSYVPERGLHPANHTFVVADPATGGERIELLVEAAANPPVVDPRPDPNSDRLTAGRHPMYFVSRVCLAVPNIEVEELHHDIRALLGLAKELPPGSARRVQITAALSKMMDALDPLDVPGSAAAARAELAEMLARPAVPSAHRITAVGHAHIDSAWLWPLRETRRKCARTFSNVLRLLETDPDLRFVCSQAVQYEWMREQYPSIFEGIRAAVAAGRWIPIGGNWVEADGNITGGESMVRQFLVGQRYFREHFGVTCTEQWIPDVFGYPASFPQIFRLGGTERFVTQKMSWNRTNRFPHHTFWWEGIDGSRVFTHFPPVDTYNASMEPFELAKAERNFADHAGSTRSLMPFGFGDGGGGPNRDMMRRYRRLRDLEGLPRVEIGSPAEFFDEAMAEYPEAPVWVGELYLEMHRGTYTSQARTKVGNRRCEMLLREAELWSVAAVDTGMPYPADALDRIWKTVLLHQFHDILPGSSIGWVHREAEASYAELIAELEDIIDGALGALVGPGPTLANAAPHDRDEVVVLQPGEVASSLRSHADVQTLADGRIAFRAAVPAMGLAPADPLPLEQPVTVEADGSGGWLLRNGVLSARLGSDGLVSSIVHLASGRELLAGAGGLGQLHHDLPLEYDAWDIEEYYRHRVEHLDGPCEIEVLDAGPAVCRVAVRRSFRSSRLMQTFELRAGAPMLEVTVDVDWAERDHLLKIAWPLDLLTADVVRHIQYGHIRTPIHTNTSWDAARFEVCAHQWIDVGEPGFGVALLGDARYGYDITRTRTTDGLPSTTARITAVKGAQYPDPQADLGEHRFRYAVMPHAGHLRAGGVITEGYRFNLPVRLAGGGSRSGDMGAVVRTDHPALVVEAVKLAEDGSEDRIVRLYEAFGGRVTGVVELAAPFERVRLVDLLEDEREGLPEAGLEVIDDRRVRVTLRPFQIVTLRLS